MSRIDCVNNRNIKILATYVAHKLGDYGDLFNGLPYPTDRYSSAEDFFLNEDEWTTSENFYTLFRRAKSMVGERYFYFYCGYSSAHLRSWGRLDYFVRIFSSPSDGFKRLPFFTKQFSDMKEMEVLTPPAYDRNTGKIRTLLKLTYHEDTEANKDYIGHTFTRGLIASIPTIWGLKPASIKQLLNAHDPEILFKVEPDLAAFDLDMRVDNDLVTVKNPGDGQRMVVGKKILLEPDSVNGQRVFLGRYGDYSQDALRSGGNRKEALLMTETVQASDRVLLKAGEIYKAPYFILDITYDRFSFVDRLSHIFPFHRKHQENGAGLIETIDRLRETIAARNQAYQELARANLELKEAKSKVDEYARTLEEKVDERTRELKKAQESLTHFNQGLEAKVKDHVEQLRRYDELRRYLSPKLCERILSTGDRLGAEPQRKMMTVVFTDIRNFSSYTENLEPEELFPLLDKYLAEMTKMIHQYDGTLNKIIGDGLLIFFGDPIPIPDHAEKAVLMAVEMQKKVCELKDEWLEYGHEFGVGIGINTGYMTVGNIGSDIHKDYTVIGNQVNVASRLESLARPGQILISQRTYSKVKHLVQVEKVGAIQVAGLRDPVVTYDVKAV
jgi:class 3 adenylate cyclase